MNKDKSMSEIGKFYLMLAITIFTILRCVVTFWPDSFSEPIKMYTLYESKGNEKYLYYSKAEMDPRLKKHEKAELIYSESGSYPSADFALGNFYVEELEDYDEAIIWFTRAYEKDYLKAIEKIAGAYTYKDDYVNAAKWYEIAISKNIPHIYITLGNLYARDLRDTENAIKYYNLEEKSNSSFPAAEFIGDAYIRNNEPVKASAYWISTLPENEWVLEYLRRELSYSEETLKKGYELQLTMPGLKNRYRGEI